MSGRPGFFIPYRYAASTRPCDYPALEPMFAAAAQRFADVLKRIEHFGAAFSRFGGERPAPRFEQDWFPRLDASAAYVMVRDLRPARIVEIGCGHSTRVMARAIVDGELETDHLCVDPAPRADIEGLRVRHFALPVDEAEESVFGMLAAGDILFIDSSHIAMPGSDVDRLVNRVLPGLPSGTIIHFHDVFLPFAYPGEWAWRGYNEQLLVGALLSSGGYDLMFSSSFVTRCMPELLNGPTFNALPLPEGAIESSLWLRKRIPSQLSYQKVSGR